MMQRRVRSDFFLFYQNEIFVMLNKMLLSVQFSCDILFARKVFVTPLGFEIRRK